MKVLPESLWRLDAAGKLTGPRSERLIAEDEDLGWEERDYDALIVQAVTPGKEKEVPPPLTDLCGGPG
jgi:hypothetical protein